MDLRERLRRLAPRDETRSGVDAGEEPASAFPTRLPDPSRPPQARGSWETAALVNVAITQAVKRQLGTVTPPWKK